MKVSELIEKLRAFDPDLQVEVNCGDIQDAATTTMDAEVTAVHLCRDLLKSEDFLRLIA